MNETVLELKKVTRAYTETAGNVLQVLRGVDLALKSGELVALVGPSGAGKSTLLHQVGLLDRPTSGQILIHGQDASQLDDKTRTRLRGQTIGFVYQFHHLLPEFSALENVILPQMILGVDLKAARQRASDLLAKVGLSARASHRPGQLSGGEQQRVAIARALANKPKILVADEPTGNLDPTTAAEVFALLQHLTQDEGLAALVATHNHDLARQMTRTVVLHQGLLVEPT